MSEQGVVEAALFSAGGPLAVEQIVATTGLGPEAVKAALAALAEAYDARESAVQVVRIGAKWTMQIRAAYAEKAHAFVPPELAADLLRTAALIAYHEPVLQSDLVRMVGSKAYEHVRDLVNRDLVRSKPEGQTLRLTTSPDFPEYFGLPVESKEEMKQLLQERAVPGASDST